MSARVFAYGSLLVVMLVWGSTFAVTKSALAEVPPLLLALLRFGVASAVLVPLAQARGGLDLLPRPLPLFSLSLMGLVGVTLFYVAYNLSLVYTSATEAALVQGCIPAVAAVLAIAFLGERLSARRALGIGTSVLGVAVVVGGGADGVDAPNPLLGDLLMLGASCCWAVYTILGKRLQRASQLAVTTYSSLIGTLLLVPAGAYDLATRPPSAVSAGTWLIVLYLGVIASALPFLLWNRALLHLDASQATNFLNLLPVVRVVTTAALLGEVPPAGQLLGGVLVMAGVWLSSATPPGTRPVTRWLDQDRQPLQRP